MAVRFEDYHSEYLDFKELVTTNRTKVYDVRSKRDGVSLGTIQWYGKWRQYCFYPKPETIFNRQCLHDIVDIMDLLMKKWQEQRARRKAS
ncbi:hypothetical protein LCGC14_2244500 [marine sediment metagenome]|uniref:Uncharacterized protein n=1 Tax=marine sediment metagenome TaxID=412755 RepID=A0A0F9FGZ4_9ZZZZ